MSPVEVTFEIDITHAEDDEAPWLDPLERDMMLEHTRTQLIQHVQHALGDITCDEHGEPPRVHITGTYNSDTEQLDVNYRVDTCCRRFLMQCITLLNRR